MNKQINRKLEVCRMNLESALQGLIHMGQISNLPDPKKKNDPALDLFVERWTLSQSKIKVATVQLKDIKTGFDKVVKNNVQSK